MLYEVITRLRRDIDTSRFPCPFRSRQRRALLFRLGHVGRRAGTIHPAGLVERVDIIALGEEGFERRVLPHSRSREAGIRHFGNINLSTAMIFSSESFDFSWYPASRITSYNVCYTKLLRSSSKSRSKGASTAKNA